MISGSGIIYDDAENHIILQERFRSMSALSNIWFPLTLEREFYDRVPGAPTLWGPMGITLDKFTNLIMAHPRMWQSGNVKWASVAKKWGVDCTFSDNHGTVRGVVSGSKIKWASFGQTNCPHLIEPFYNGTWKTVLQLTVKTIPGRPWIYLHSRKRRLPVAESLPAETEASDPKLDEKRVCAGCSAMSDDECSSISTSPLPSSRLASPSSSSSFCSSFNEELEEEEECFASSSSSSSSVAEEEVSQRHTFDFDIIQRDGMSKTDEFAFARLVDINTTLEAGAGEQSWLKSFEQVQSNAHARTFKKWVRIPRRRDGSKNLKKTAAKKWTGWLEWVASLAGINTNEWARLMKRDTEKFTVATKEASISNIPKPTTGAALELLSIV